MPRHELPAKSGQYACVQCGKEIVKKPGPGRPKKFCNDHCRDKYKRSITGVKEAGALPPDDHVKKYLISAADPLVVDDAVRDTVSAIVRESMHEAVKDKVLAAAEMMTDMLPLALAQCFKDLQSESWIERKTAYTSLMKYGFVFAPKETEEKQDLSTINVILGGSVDPAIKVDQPAAIEDGVESWEADWPECVKCGRHTHPDNFTEDEKCMTCAARDQYYNDPLHG